MKLYYWGYKTYVPDETYNVNQLADNCCYGMQDIRDDWSNLQIGMAVFMKDENGFYHVGYYIGGGKVMESNYLRDEDGKIEVDGCRLVDLRGSNITKCAYLQGVDYDSIMEVLK